MTECMDCDRVWLGDAIVLHIECEEIVHLLVQGQSGVCGLIGSFSYLYKNIGV